MIMHNIELISLSFTNDVVEKLHHDQHNDTLLKTYFHLWNHVALYELRAIVVDREEREHGRYPDEAET